MAFRRIRHREFLSALRTPHNVPSRSLELVRLNLVATESTRGAQIEVHETLYHPLQHSYYMERATHFGVALGDRAIVGLRERRKKL